MEKEKSERKKGYYNSNLTVKKESLVLLIPVSVLRQ